MKLNRTADGVLTWLPQQHAPAWAVRHASICSCKLMQSFHVWIGTYTSVLLHQQLPILLPTLLMAVVACRKYMEEFAKAESHQIELFLNQVPLLAKLSRPDKQRLVDAFVEESFPAGATIIREGDPGDKFYIIKRCAQGAQHAALLASSRLPVPVLYPAAAAVASAIVFQHSNSKSACCGACCTSLLHALTKLYCLLLLLACYACSGEAVVTQAGKEVNRLFKSDFFGERALLVNEPRGATVAASQATVCIVLDRETFTEILGPLDSAMTVSIVVLCRIAGGLLPSSLPSGALSHSKWALQANPNMSPVKSQAAQ